MTMGTRAKDLECIFKVNILSLLKKIGKINSSEKREADRSPPPCLAGRVVGRYLLAKMFNCFG
jgi:hypothetical protein